MKLYEFGPTRSIRVRWTLQELGVSFEAESVNLIAGAHRCPEEHMDGRTFVVGDAVTVADFVLAHTLDWAKTANALTDCRGSKPTWKRFIASAVCH